MHMHAGCPRGLVVVNCPAYCMLLARLLFCIKWIMCAHAECQTVVAVASLAASWADGSWEYLREMLSLQRTHVEGGEYKQNVVALNFSWVSAARIQSVCFPSIIR